jgi:hypothetical protein
MMRDLACVALVAKTSSSSDSPAPSVSAPACNLTENIDTSAASTASEDADSPADWGGRHPRRSAPWPAETSFQKPATDKCWNPCQPYCLGLGQPSGSG